jgi:hypothetical protein
MPKFTELTSTQSVKNHRATLVVRLSDVEAMALAQLCKRFGHDDAARFSNRHDGGQERDDMRSGMNTLERALAQAGFAPR